MGSAKLYTAAKVLALLGLLTMTGILIYGFTVGDVGTEGRVLLAMVDLYGGFALFSGWRVYWEKSPCDRSWVTLMMALGSFTAIPYALIACVTSRGDWERSGWVTGDVTPARYRER